MFFQGSACKFISQQNASVFVSIYDDICKHE
jgi:hypothetical protein